MQLELLSSARVAAMAQVGAVYPDLGESLFDVYK